MAAIGLTYLLYFFTQPTGAGTYVPQIYPAVLPGLAERQNAPGSSNPPEEAPLEEVPANPRTNVPEKDPPSLPALPNIPPKTPTPSHDGTGWVLVESKTESHHTSSNKEQETTKRTEETSFAEESSTEEGEPVNPEFPMNINQATADALMTVDGIGEKKAQAILEFLADTGGITQMEELLEVKGIGEKTLAKLNLYFYAE